MNKKIKTLSELQPLLQEIRKKGERVVFTNGCFDLLHIGHTRYLSEAKALGDYLLLALNSDSSIRGLKGEKRPIIPQDERAELLAALESVDFVTIFDEPDPLNTIKAIEPDILVKGGDWGDDEIIGSDFVKSCGGEVKRIPYIEGSSTTNLVEVIIERYCRG